MPHSIYTNGFILLWRVCGVPYLYTQSYPIVCSKCPIHPLHCLRHTPYYVESALEESSSHPFCFVAVAKREVRPELHHMEANFSCVIIKFKTFSIWQIHHALVLHLIRNYLHGIQIKDLDKTCVCYVRLHRHCLWIKSLY